MILNPPRCVTLLVAWALSAAWTAWGETPLRPGSTAIAPAPAGVDTSVPVDTVFARIDHLRASGDYAGALTLCGNLTTRLASDPAAMAWQRQDAARIARTLAEALAWPEDVRRALLEADSLRARISPAWEAGRFEEARATCERQLEIRRRVLGPDHPEIPSSLNDLAVLLQMQGAYDQAEPLMRAALEQHRRLRGELHPEVVNSLNNLSCLLRDKGDYAAAEPLARAALAGSLRLRERDDPVVANLLNSLGGICYYLGDYARAEPLFREALAIRRRKLPEDHEDTVQSLNNVAFLLKAQGDLAGAEGLLREALAMQRRLRGNEHPIVASHIQNLANTLTARGQHAEAIALLEEALAILRRLLGDEHPRIPQVMTSLASSLGAQGDTARAESLLHAALDLRRKVLGVSHPDVAWTLSGLGQLEQGRGRYAAALALYGQALEIRQRAFGDTHPLVAHSLSDLGAGRLARREYPAAESLLAQAARIFEVARLRAGSGLERATFETSPYRDLALARLLLDDPVGAWAATERAQGRVLADLLCAAGERQLTPEEAAREDSLKAALTLLESQIQALAGAPGAPPDAARENEQRSVRNALLATQAAWCAFEHEIAARHPVSEGQTFELERVQRALGPHTAIVGWLDGGVEAGEHRAWGYVLRDTGPVRWVSLDPAARDRHGRPRADAAAAYRAALEVAGAWPFHIPATDRITRDAQDLGQLWLAPLQPQLAGVEHLVVVPAGPMLGIPVESLGSESGQTLGDLFAISYVPSATVYTWLREGRAAREPAHPATGASLQTALLVGDPPFSPAHLAAMGGAVTAAPDEAASAARVAPPPGEVLAALPRLLGTRAEVRRAAAVFPHAVELLGPQASEQSLARLAADDELARFDVIHLATHAVVDAECPDRSALVFARAGLPDPVAAAAAGERVYDGLVTTGDIVREWSLDARLVTLSGCQTGLGRPADGEGYVGLAHAFLQAGAGCVLVSQWKVDDETTALLMGRFYEDVAGSYTEDRGAGPAAPLPPHVALRETRRWLRAQEGTGGEHPRAHPALWASFILIGDPGGE